MPIAFSSRLNDINVTSQPHAAIAQYAFAVYADYHEMIQDKTHRISACYQHNLGKNAAQLLMSAKGDAWHFPKAIPLRPGTSDAHKRDLMILFNEEQARICHYEGRQLGVPDIDDFPDNPHEMVPNVITTMQVMLPRLATEKDDPVRRTGPSFDYLSPKHGALLKKKYGMEPGSYDTLPAADGKVLYPSMFVALHYPKGTLLPEERKIRSEEAVRLKQAVFTQNMWEIWAFEPYRMSYVGTTSRLRTAVAALKYFEEDKILPYVEEDPELRLVQYSNSLHHSLIDKDRIKAVDSLRPRGLN